MSLSILVLFGLTFLSQSTAAAGLVRSNSDSRNRPILIQSYLPDDNEILKQGIQTNQIYDSSLLKKNAGPAPAIKTCAVSPSLASEIQSYQGVAQKIFNAVLGGDFKGRTYDDLAYFVDKFGSRLSGTENLENAIDFMLEKMKADGLENVHGEEAMVPHWVRGEESAEIILPRKKKVALLGLGFSVGTPPEGITAEVLVVKSFDDLRAKADQAKGKIVVYNQDFVSYGQTVKYRGSGASEAAKVGALASLIRSVTPFSLNTPHGGMQSYQANVTRIPTACITIEDAELLQRFQNRGWKTVITLKMGAETLPLSRSRNVVGEIIGKQKPDEVVIVSGHIDSWDVGQGASDDGGGMMISVQVLSLLKHLNLTARRTLRAVLWTAEEPGLWGVQDYVKKHEEELSKINAVFESDIGTFKPLGLDFAGSFDSGCIVQEVLKLLSPINATQFRGMPDVGSDIGYFIEKGVPGFSINTANQDYFWYHHTEADTMTVQDPNEMDLCTAVWALSSYVFADMSMSLPRKA